MTHHPLVVSLFCAVGTCWAVPGDMDQDADYDLFDFSWFQRCYTGPPDAPGFLPPPFPWCVEVFDRDANNAIDELDYVHLVARSGLQSFVDLPIQGDAYGVAVGDVDGDGDADIVVGIPTPSPTRLVVFRNLGSRVFEPVEHFGLGANRVVLADVDGDGDLDFIGSQDQAHQVFVGRNDGNGGLESVAFYDMSLPIFLTAGDVDGDADVDFFAGPYLARLFRNSGNGSFTMEPFIEFGPPKGHITLADLDLDGDLDVLYLTREFSPPGAYLVTHVNPGNGEFEAPTQYSLGFGNTGFGLTAGDFDGDLKPDVAVVSSQPYEIQFFRNMGDGVLAHGDDIPISSVPYDITSADVDRDGDLDLITPNSERSTLSIFSNRGDGSFDGEIQFDSGARPFQAAVADFDQDQRPDIVSANADGDRVGLLFQNTNGSWLAPRAYEDELIYNRIAVADMNQDGIVDIVSSAGPLVFPGWGIVTVHAGQPDGENVLYDQFDLDWSTQPISTESSAIATTDVDLDGDADVVVGAFDNWIGTGGLFVLQNDGTGTLTSPTQFDTTNAPTEIRVTDIDGDADDDVLIVNGVDPTVQILLVTSGQLEPGPAIDIGGAAFSFDVGDLDGDSDVDVAVARIATDDLVIAFRQSNGDWQLGEPLPTGDYPVYVRAVDLNGDNSPDLVVSNRDSMTVSVYYNNGVGQFLDGMTLTTDAGIERLWVDDVDSDGDTDLLIGTSSQLGNPRGVLTFLQTSQGEFVQVEFLPMGVSPSDLALTDVDGDLDLDLITARSTVLSVMENSVHP